MKSIWLIAASAAALSLAACGSGFGPKAPLKPVSRLDCPERQGSLTRTSASPDGRSCQYAGDDGAIATLRYVALVGNAEATLSPIEAELKALIPDINRPVSPERMAEKAADQEKEIAKAEQEVVEAQARAKAAPADADAAEAVADALREVADAKRDLAEAKTDTMSGRRRGGGDHDRVNIDLPGFHINTEGGDAKLKIAGIKIDADEDSDTVHVSRKPKSGWGRSFTVDANNNGAVIRTETDGRNNVKRMLILASEDAGPQGDKVAGYVVRGPKTGPLIVGTIRSKSDHHEKDIDGGDLLEDLGKLVKKNAGG